MTCKGCLNSPAVCPCQPVACPLLPKTFRSAGTCTDRNVSATSQRAGHTRWMSSKSDCIHPASKEMSGRRIQQSDVIHADSGQKQRSYDVGCGFVQFCHKHIFAAPTAVSPVTRRARKVSQDPGTITSSQSHCDSFNVHFNPCYSNSSPPDDDDDDDDINLDAASLCDSLCSSSHSRRTHALPAVSEMSESCFEGLQSSSYKELIGFPRQFRPLSWAGPVDDCLVDSGCSCCNQSAFSTVMKSDSCCISGAQLLKSVSQIASDELCVPLSAETPLYWELELPGTNGSTHLASQTSPLPDTCQKLGSPLRMGTLTFDAGNVCESSDTHAAAAKLLPKPSCHVKPPCHHSRSLVDTAKAPKMGCPPARCCICRDCQHVCSQASINRQNRTVSSRKSQPHEIHIPHACKCIKQRRCPTPPRMLSPCIDNDDSVRVPVADI